MNKLINDLMRLGYLKSDAVIEAFSDISRMEFVRDDFLHEADVDIPLPIGCGQTISQPRTVAFMFELLDPKKGQKILDIGSGSGWTSALLAHIVGKKGKVVSLEILEDICAFGKKNIEKFGYISNGIVELHCQDAYAGYEELAPYDRILVSAAVDEIPVALKQQLKIGGIMVIPVHNDIWFLEKRGDDDFYKEEFPGFSFVPFVSSRDL